MSIVSTVRQVSSGKSLNWQIVGWVSGGAVVGGIAGNIVFEVFYGCLKMKSMCS